MKLFKQLFASFALLMLSTSVLAIKTTVTFIHTDHLGSPVLATKEDGSVKWREDYQPFGKQLTNQDSNNNVGFTGHRDDKSLGLTYMQARWYNPEIGRFYALDPILFRDVHSFNRYVYGNNNPYKYVDPDGRDTLGFSFNLNGGMFGKLGATYGLNIVFDSEGNLGLQFVFGAGYDTGGYSATANLEFSNAENLFQLEGIGSQQSFDITAGDTVIEGGIFDGEGYEGMSFGGGVGVGTVFGGSSLETHTTTLASINVFEGIRKTTEFASSLFGSVTEYVSGLFSDGEK